MSCHGAAAESRVGRLEADSLVTIYISLVGCVCVLPFSGNPLSTLNLLAPAPAAFAWCWLQCCGDVLFIDQLIGVQHIIKALAQPCTTVAGWVSLERGGTDTV